MEDMQQFYAKKIQPVPKGFKTVRQIAEENGMSLAAADRRVRILVRAGKWERRDLWVMSGEYVRPTPHYGRKGK
jgi:hypothetical protein